MSSTCRAGDHLLVAGVQQQAGHLAGETLRVGARVGAAERVPGQHVRRGHAGGAQQVAQFAGDLGPAEG
jgi:hypothetical protein